MASSDHDPETTLQLTRSIPAPREKVFQAWTDPETLKRWFGPSDAYATPVAELDLRVGGRYRIQMRSPEGNLYTVVGTYREIRPPEKLVFTWSWEGTEMDTGETLVTVEFRTQGKATEVVLTHERFPDVKARKEHTKGWAGCLDRLAKAV